MNKKGITVYELLFVICIIICIGITILYFYALITYANTPVSEMPVWAWWILQSKGN